MSTSTPRATDYLSMPEGTASQTAQRGEEVASKTAPADKGGAELPCLSQCCVRAGVSDQTIRSCLSPGKSPFYAVAIFVLSLIAYISSLDNTQFETLNKVSFAFTILSLGAALFLYVLGSLEFASLVHTVDRLDKKVDAVDKKVDVGFETLNIYMFGDDEEKDRLRNAYIERKAKAEAEAAAALLREQEAAEKASLALSGGNTTSSRDVEEGQQRAFSDDESGNGACHHGGFSAPSIGGYGAVDKRT
jgi:hypothetical protein